MSERKGTIQVQTSDIFPIIKKWLYSEHDIFLRELVANATDAITKRATLARTQNLEIPTGDIQVIIDKKAKQIRIIDNGIGMTEEEVEKYIAHLAFSGAEDFVKKMKESGTDTQDIIGKFGLGFYSSFMVADEGVVDTLSLNEGAKPARWSCNGDVDYTFSDSDRKEIGTTVTLNLNKESEEFLDGFKLRSTLKNFCDFMPYGIHLHDLEQEAEDKKREEEEKKKAKDEGKDEKDVVETKAVAAPINDTTPLWKQDPKELKDEDYIQFHRKLFPTDPEPLFWLHLKVDHPFTLEGILFFPKINPNKPFNESNIRLYCKQVFVSDNVKNIIPEFLSMLKGAIDSSDIPLNVSRSSLQGDPNIKRISNYIVKKVAEALKKLHKNDREKFERIWPDIALFVKYGVVSEDKFDQQMREHVLFKNSEGKLITLQEYRDSTPKDYAEKMKDKVIYFETGRSDGALRKQLLDEKVQTIETDDQIDPHFMQHIEMKKQGDSEYKFSSVDSEIENVLASENSSEDDMKVKDLFSQLLLGKSINEEKKEESEDEKKQDDVDSFAGMEVEVNKIKNSSAPAYFKVDEQMKRFRNMAKSMGQDSTFPVKKTLVVNPNNPLIKNALRIWEKGDQEPLVKKICHHVEDLATISSEGLKDNEREMFVSRSQSLIEELSAHVH